MKTRDRKRRRVRLGCERLDERVLPASALFFGSFHPNVNTRPSATGTPVNSLPPPRNTVPSPSIRASTFGTLPNLGGFNLGAGAGGGTFQVVQNFNNFQAIPSFSTFDPLTKYPTFSPTASFPTFVATPSFETFSPFISTSSQGARPSFGAFTATPVVTAGQPATLNPTPVATTVARPVIVASGPQRTPVATTVSAPVVGTQTTPVTIQTGGSTTITGGSTAIPTISSSLGSLVLSTVFPTSGTGAGTSVSSVLGSVFPTAGAAM